MSCTNDAVSDNATSDGDSMYAYATDFLTMALLWHGFHNAIKMGDCNRILSYWKFLIAIFNHMGHSNLTTLDRGLSC